MDRISSLPDNVIVGILNRVPLKDAVRTSVLSRVWREQWCAVPQLVFDWEGFPLYKDETQNEYDNRVSRIVDQVLLAHQGPIHKFMLSIELTSCPDIGRWIRFLSTKGVEEFILNIWDPLYRLPSCFFLLKEITYLKLSDCLFYPPSSFTGYCRLAVLDLRVVTFTNNGLEFLLSVCPLLKKLSLKDVSGCTKLRIRSQTLVELSIVGGYGHLDLEYAPVLAIACIKLYPPFEVSGDNVFPSIVNVLGHLPSLERLELLETTLREFAKGDDGIPVKFPVLFPLWELSIHMSFEYMAHLLAAFCIFRSSLALETLDIKVTHFDDEEGGISDDFWQAQEDCCTFSHLRTVQLTEITGTISELKFIEFILANGPVLESLLIDGGMSDHEEEMSDDEEEMSDDEEGISDDFWKSREDCRTFSHLRTLELTKITGTNAELRFIEFILANSPVLESLLIEGGIYDDEEGGISDGYFQAPKDGRTFSHLRTVRFTKNTGTNAELKFIEFVLANAPVLEGLLLEFEEDVDDLEILRMGVNVWEFFKELNGFRRSSARAQITLLSPFIKFMF